MDKNHQEYKWKKIVKIGVAILIISIIALVAIDQYSNQLRDEYDYAEYQYNYYHSIDLDSPLRESMLISYSSQMAEIDSQLELFETIQPYLPVGIAIGIIITIAGVVSLAMSKNTSKKLKTKIKENKVDEEVTKTPDKEALNILNLRYAKGEITKEKYEQMKKDLSK